MRKRELVHFHALLDRIRWFVDERGDLPEETLGEYDELDVAPTAVYRSKQAHEDAVVTLTESLAETLGDDSPATRRTDDSDATDESTPPVHSD
ncbi:UPF0058 family protein [Halomarina oriensis]|uniref:Metal-binding protein n=1 Tax=Halomarina oriensis TaxID=671145 RepID=A0A6B0GHY8_9EURY|nr:UPF0058 family protein [Halomarina oriensis]MWG33517.1 hypothetical protein [Halomarina oriensis]